MSENPFAGASRDPVALLEQLIVQVSGLRGEVTSLKGEMADLKQE